MITRYVISALALTAVSAGGYAWYADKRVDRLAAEVESLENRLGNCSARVKNIQEDAQDDATVDDPSLFDVPDSWMFAE